MCECHRMLESRMIDATPLPCSKANPWPAHERRLENRTIHSDNLENRPSSDNLDRRSRRDAKAV
eukprot:6206180-Pleurochrysis_carterae.AAC.6